MTMNASINGLPENIDSKLQHAEKTHVDSDSLTLLFAANGKKLAKRINADGSKQGYDLAYQFQCLSTPVASINDLFNIMRYVSQHPERNICIIRGKPHDHIREGQVHKRRLSNYMDVPRSWAMFDIDDLALPEAVDPTSQAAVVYAISKMPACFHDRDCVYHFSSSAGLARQVFKGHLAFLLEEPVGSADLRNWAVKYVNQDSDLVKIDPALFNAVQIHYIADPIFEDLSMDPFAGQSRVGLIQGTHRRVPVSSIIEPPVPIVLAPMPERVVVRDRHRASSATSWQSALNEIHDDRLGLHNGIVHVIKRAVQESGIEFDRFVIKDAIRQRVAQAITEGSIGRKQSYLDEETGDERLDRTFDWAIGRGFAIRYIERSKTPSFSDALTELEAITTAQKPGQHAIADYAFTAARIGFFQCPSRMRLDDMLAAVHAAAHHQLQASFWEVIEQRLRDRYQQLVQSTLSTRKITRHQTIMIRSLDEIDTTKPGIHMVKAPMGSGKTEQVARRVVEQSNGLACVINHRISLSADLANRLGLNYYKEASGSSGNGVATCINSIVNKDIKHTLGLAAAVVIDEFSQTVDHLAVGPVEKRSHVYQDFLQLLREKKIVALLDADLNNRDIDLVEAAIEGEKPVHVYEMPESWAEYQFRILPTPTALMTSICNDIRQGENVMLAVDSKTGVQRIAQQIREEMKGDAEAFGESLRLLTIHADNSGGEAQKAFLDNPDAESSKYDLLIYSPSISSGVSLKSGHFTRVYGLYNGVVPGREFFQMLRRNRTAKMLTVASKPIHGMSRVERPEDRLQGYHELRQDMGLALLEDDAISALKVNVQYQQELQQMNAFNRLVILAEDMGYQIVCEQLIKEDDLAACDFDPMQREQIKAAQNLLEFQFDELNRKNLKTQQESYQLKRHRIQRALGLGENSPSDEDFDYIKVFGQSAPRQFELLRSTEEENRDLMANLPAAEVWSYKEARKHRIVILEMLVSDAIDFAGAFDQNKLKEAMEYLIEQGPKMNRLGIASKIVPIKYEGTIDATATLKAYKAKAVIGEFFRKLGLTLNSSGTSASYRRYSVDQESLKRTLAYVAARGNIELSQSGWSENLIQTGTCSAFDPCAFARPDLPDGAMIFFILKEAAEAALGKQGSALVMLLGRQRTVPLTPSWIGANQQLKDPKTIRQWVNAWGSVSFDGLYRYEYKPVGIRGAGGRKQSALSLVDDPTLIQEHLERLLSVKVANVRRVSDPANTVDIGFGLEAIKAKQAKSRAPKSALLLKKVA